MKKLFNYALIGAIALTGSTMLTSCSSSDDAAAENTNPNYDPVAQTVKTQFVLNVSSAANNNTRQSSTTVQRNTNFRGIQDAKLIALSATNPTYLAPFNGESTTAFDVCKTFQLGTLYGSSAVTPGSNQTSSSNRILELAMPLKTNSMLVYARAIPSGVVEEDGKVTMTITEAPESSTISLVSRLNNRGTEYNQTCDLGATILNRILSANVTGAAAGDFVHNGYTNVEALPALDWKTMSVAYNPATPTAALAEILAKAYLTLTTFRDGELRAGSGSALFNIAYSLYNTAKIVYGAEATDDGEANAQRLALEIMNRITTFFNLDTETNTVSEWKSIGSASESGTIIANLIAAGIVTAENWSTRFGAVVSGDLRNLPTVFGLPFGAAILYKKDDGTFDYRNSGTSLMEQNKATTAANYMYPAELLYFDNSAIRVNDAEQKVSDYPNGVNPWDTEANRTAKSWTSGAVTSTTRSVAVKNNINYGVALLKSSVLKSADTYRDNRYVMTENKESDRIIPKGDLLLTLTGILIGGVNPRMDWQFVRKFSSGEFSSFDGVIYDSSIASGTVPTPAGQENYTLVYDNFNSTVEGTNGLQAAQNKVLIALEFKNNGDPFWGKHNLIPTNGFFYLVAEVPAPTTAQVEGLASKWPTDHQIPPVYGVDGEDVPDGMVAGESKKIGRVFMQDFMTEIKFKLVETSLKNAYYTMPDLRASQMSLGLSVDLQWIPGLQYNDINL